MTEREQIGIGRRRGDEDGSVFDALAETARGQRRKLADMAWLIIKTSWPLFVACGRDQLRFERAISKCISDMRLRPKHRSKGRRDQERALQDFLSRERDDTGTG